MPFLFLGWRSLFFVVIAHHGWLIAAHFEASLNYICRSNQENENERKALTWCNYKFWLCRDCVLLFSFQKPFDEHEALSKFKGNWLQVICTLWVLQLLASNGMRWVLLLLKFLTLVECKWLCTSLAKVHNQSHENIHAFVKLLSIRL